MMYAILDSKLAEIERANLAGVIEEEDVDLLLTALRDTEDQLRRVQKATIGRCASCGSEGRVVYFDREAWVCADYDDCWAFLWPDGLPAARAGKEARDGDD